jgi:hypothetical protein
MKMRTLMATAAAAISALTVSATVASAAPAGKSVPVKMSDAKLDQVVGGGMQRSEGGFRVTTLCSFGNNCSGNGGNGNGNTRGFLNIGNGNLAGASVLSGNAVYVYAPSLL